MRLEIIDEKRYMTVRDSEKNTGDINGIVEQVVGDVVSLPLALLAAYVIAELEMQSAGVFLYNQRSMWKMVVQ